MSKTTVLVGVALLVGACASAQNDVGVASDAPFVAPSGCPAVEAIAPDVDGVRETVRYLADDALGGRLAGSDGERCAAAYIAWRMERAGLEPGMADGWYQPVPLASVVNPHAPGGTGNNVVGVLLPRGARADAPAIVIGAHYDHLGMGEFGSLATAPGIHNGADDNASGVAVLLEAAERLASDPPSVPVVFVAFTGEESGLLGSAVFVNDPPANASHMGAMINMDMVGRLRDQPLIVNGVGTAEEWTAIVERAAARANLPIAPSPDGYGPSDQTSFYAHDIPVLHLFTNVHGEYHRPEDDWQLIDYAGIERIAGMVVDITRDVATRRAQLALVRQAAPQPASGGYGAWLGTVPDFTPVEHGVRLSGASAGSPAEEAGLRAGDILIRMGEFEVADLYALTDALRAYQPGDVVDVTVLRDGAEMTYSVQLGSRSSRTE